MKMTAFRVLAIVLMLAAAAQPIGIYFLPSDLPTTSVEHRRAYFLFDIFFGSALIFQSLPLLIAPDVASRSTKSAGKLALGVGILCIALGVSLGYRHMAGSP